VPKQKARRSITTTTVACCRCAVASMSKMTPPLRRSARGRRPSERLQEDGFELSSSAPSESIAFTKNPNRVSASKNDTPVMNTQRRSSRNQVTPSSTMEQATSLSERQVRVNLSPKSLVPKEFRNTLLLGTLSSTPLAATSISNRKRRNQDVRGSLSEEVALMETLAMPTAPKIVPTPETLEKNEIRVRLKVCSAVTQPLADTPLHAILPPKREPATALSKARVSNRNKKKRRATSQTPSLDLSNSDSGMFPPTSVASTKTPNGSRNKRRKKSPMSSSLAMNPSTELPRNKKKRKSRNQSLSLEADPPPVDNGMPPPYPTSLLTRQATPAETPATPGTYPTPSSFQTPSSLFQTPSSFQTSSSLPTPLSGPSVSMSTSGRLTPSISRSASLTSSTSIGGRGGDEKRKTLQRLVTKFYSFMLVSTPV